MFAIAEPQTYGTQLVGHRRVDPKPLAARRDAEIATLENVQRPPHGTQVNALRNAFAFQGVEVGLQRQLVQRPRPVRINPRQRPRINDLRETGPVRRSPAALSSYSLPAPEGAAIVRLAAQP